MKRVCIVCEKTFEARSGNTRYCSDECRAVAAKMKSERNEESQKIRRRINRENKRRKKREAKMSVTMQDVLKFMRENDCQYVEAITKLEEQRYGL